MEILNDSRIEYIDIFDGNHIHKQPTLHDQVDVFITRYRYESLLAFTDGAVTEFGRGSSAVVLLPLEVGVPEVEVKQLHATLMSSLETEIAAIVLAMEQAVMYLEDNAGKSMTKQCKLIILSDCKSAIKCILRRSVVHHFHVLMSRVRSSACALRDWNIRIALAWIPFQVTLIQWRRVHWSRLGLGPTFNPAGRARSGQVRLFSRLLP